MGWGEMLRSLWQTQQVHLSDLSDVPHVTPMSLSGGQEWLRHGRGGVEVPVAQEAIGDGQDVHECFILALTHPASAGIITPRPKFATMQDLSPLVGEACSGHCECCLMHCADVCQPQRNHHYRGKQCTEATSCQDAAWQPVQAPKC
jgi:hypothetical protein